MLEALHPAHWQFRVVATNSRTYSFPTLTASLHQLPLNFRWQNFVSAARQADVLILDTHLTNLGYLAAAAVRKPTTPLILWGHASNMNSQAGGWRPYAGKRLKHRYLQGCDRFFAYTPGQASLARSAGLPESRISILNNTLDIERHRAQYVSLQSLRGQVRREFEFGDEDKVLLMVGRLLPERRVDFLCDTFRYLGTRKNYRLVIIGDGPQVPLVQQLQRTFPKQVTAPGHISSPEALGRYYLAADAFIMPGAIGLAPLEAIAYDLPVFGFDLSTHGPEFEYLTPENSCILSRASSPEQFAGFLERWFSNQTDRSLSPSPYASISQLRLQDMVRNFINGVDETLAWQNR